MATHNLNTWELYIILIHVGGPRFKPYLNTLGWTLSQKILLYSILKHLVYALPADPCSPCYYSHKITSDQLATLLFSRRSTLLYWSKTNVLSQCAIQCVAKSQ